MMSAQNPAILRKFLTPDEPFGPINSSKITDNAAAEVLFNRENEIYKALRSNPAIIVGRRGAGKTAYLKCERFSRKFDFVVEFNKSVDFAKLIKRIQGILTEPIFAEESAELWDIFLHALMFQEIIYSDVAGNEKFPLTRDYLAKLGLRDKRSVDDAAWAILDIVANRMKDGLTGIAADCLRGLADTKYEHALLEVVRFLNRFRFTAVILLDNLDDLVLDVPRVAHAITGLLKCVGQFNGTGLPFAVRFCLPAEKYHEFMDLSSNPLKDFEKHLTLHWHSLELLSIAAQRMQLYANIYATDWKAKVEAIDVRKRQGAKAVLETLLPKRIKNGLGFEEETEAYLLRHTQLLPRQLLWYLNAIWSEARRENGIAPQLIPEAAVIAGVRMSEEKIVEEIFSGFRTRYPKAKEVCERCIPELPLTFSYGDLHSVFNQFGKKAMDGDDFFDFRSLLVEIGAVGRVIDENERYWIGQFEYTAPHKLVISTDDEMCLHPIFASTFSCRIAKTRPLRRTVYPYGSDLDGPDHREFPR